MDRCSRAATNKHFLYLTWEQLRAFSSQFAWLKVMSLSQRARAAWGYGRSSIPHEIALRVSALSLRNSASWPGCLGYAIRISEHWVLFASVLLATRLLLSHSSWRTSDLSQFLTMASGPITSWEIDGGNSGNSVRLYFWGLQNHCRWCLQPWN